MPTREQYKATVEGWVEQGVGIGTSADALYQSLRGTPYYAPREIVRDVWNETVRGISYVPLIQALGEEDIIPRSWVKQTSWQFNQPFAALVKIEGVNTLSGETETAYATLLYNNMPTRGQIFDDIPEKVATEASGADIINVTYSLQRVSHVFGQRWSTP